MPEPVHEGNLDNDAREAHIRQSTRRALVRSASASRAREEQGDFDCCYETRRCKVDHRLESVPVRVEVRPVIDATPRTPPLGHWWTANIGSVSEVNDGGRESVVSARCVVCGERPEAHE